MLPNKLLEALYVPLHSTSIRVDEVLVLEIRPIVQSVVSFDLLDFLTFPILCLSDNNLVHRRVHNIGALAQGFSLRCLLSIPPNQIQPLNGVQYNQYNEQNKIRDQAAAVQRLLCWSIEIRAEDVTGGLCHEKDTSRGLLLRLTADIPGTPAVNERGDGWIYADDVVWITMVSLDIFRNFTTHSSKGALCALGALQKETYRQQATVRGDLVRAADTAA